MLTRARAAVLIAAVLTLAGCGNIHPGAAAVVDDHEISMSTFDKTARIYCELTLLSAQEQGVASVPNSDVRRQTISDMVTIFVARDLAEDKGITLDKQSYELAPAQAKEIGAAFPKGDDAETVELAIENSQEIAAIAIALGEKSTGELRTEENAAQLSEAGEAEIRAAFEDHDIEISPRFGLSSTLKEIGPTGSLSVADIDFESTNEAQLPADQRCA